MATSKQQDEATPSRVGNIRQSLTDSVAVALSGPRLQLAAKAGLAAGLAFLIAPLMPGAAAQYPYYAPLGALVAMYENVSGSMKQGVQTLVRVTRTEAGFDRKALVDVRFVPALPGIAREL